MKLSAIQPLADSLLEQLRSACVRLEIAGSIRRQKPDPKDIEIVCIPSTGEYTVPVYEMFAAPAATVHQVNHLEDALMTLIAGGEWEFDPIVKRNGPRYKRLRHVTSGVCCDLFLTTSREWGYTFTIRTGPSDFSKALVTYAHRRTMFFNGNLLHKHAPVFDSNGEVKPCPAGERCLRIVETPEERDVFRALEMPWIEPSRRNANILYALTPRGVGH